MKSKIKQTAAAQNISAVGVCRARVFSELEEKLGENTPMVTKNIAERIDPFLHMPTAKSIIVCLFSYNNGGKRSNLSLYARGEDYHKVVKRKLEKLCAVLEEKGYLAQSYCDTGELCERYLAYQAGLGFFGRNNFLINPEYGSYTFIGYILTDAEIEADKPLEGGCQDCGRCEKCCPGGALSKDSFNAQKCASYITQKKGDLTLNEREIIKKSGTVWGCDICQTVCPHNENARLTEIDEFRTNLIENLQVTMAESNREFKKKYQDRAFSWRGFDVIKRNIEIQEE